MKEITLITGGARSGKSSFGLKIAEKYSKPFYIATGWAGDEEMERRIAAHKKERGEKWSTIETRTELPDALSEASEKGADIIVIDCLTLWVSNIICEKGTESVPEYLENFKKSLENSNVSLVIVTNETGMGIVPMNAMARDFRDSAGMVNRHIAEIADRVIFTVCGCPMYIKGEKTDV